MKHELKTSFAPIAGDEARILILGSLPGDRSLDFQQYYAHPRNRFWRVLAEITRSKLPRSYEEKLDLLHQNKIGLWDVVREAKRSGSLDTNIFDEIPNDVEGFIDRHPQLKIIGFNGAKSGQLFDKYFARKDDLKYILLPSTSPANASFTFERLCEKWREILPVNDG